MFYHIVLMRFSAEADEAFFARVEDYVRRIKAECADVVTYFAGANVASRSDGLTHSIVGVFRSSQAHDAYQVSPAHQEMKEFMMRYITRIVVLDTEDGA